MPITLDVSKEQSEKWKIGDRVLLRNTDTQPLAVLTVESIYTPDKALEGDKVFGSPDDKKHPAVAYLLDDAGEIYVGGSVQGIQLPAHYDFIDYRRTPAELRQKIERQRYVRVVGFQTRNPMHRSHRELTLKAARETKANILIHPVVGMTKPGDVDHYTRVRCYIEILKTYPSDMAMLSLLPLAMRMAGPREAVCMLSSVKIMDVLILLLVEIMLDLEITVMVNHSMVLMKLKNYLQNMLKKLVLKSSYL